MFEGYNGYVGEMKMSYCSMLIVGLAMTLS